jgi:hypothetical protein
MSHRDFRRHVERERERERESKADIVTDSSVHMTALSSAIKQLGYLIMNVSFLFQFRRGNETVAWVWREAWNTANKTKDIWSCVKSHFRRLQTDHTGKSSRFTSGNNYVVANCASDMLFVILCNLVFVILQILVKIWQHRNHITESQVPLSQKLITLIYYEQIIIIRNLFPLIKVT